MAGKTPEEQHAVKTYGWAARDPSGVLSPFTFFRRATADEDVRLKVLYSGVCHTDLQAVKDEFGSMYPIVPGLEAVGIATEIGSKVTKVKVGDKVGVGSFIGSCGKCEECANDREVYCPELIRGYGATYPDGTPTYGGYSNEMVVNERFVYLLPDNLPLERVPPLLNAGVTVYSPMKYYGLDKPGMHLGVVGLGGLGHLAVKIAKALGARVTVISTSPSKKDEAINGLGADAFLNSKDDEQMKAAYGTFDGIIDTVPVFHPIKPYIELLKNHSKLVLVGVPAAPLELDVYSLAGGRKGVVSSIAGSVKETQEILDFAAKHHITADVEIIPMDYINTAMERLERGDVHYRFVIDIGNTLIPSES